MYSTVERSGDSYADNWGGQQSECELCGSEGVCADQYGFLACRDCCAELLPKSGLL